MFCHQASFWKITRSLTNIMVSNHPSIIFHFSRFYFQLICHDDDWCGEKHYFICLSNVLFRTRNYQKLSTNIHLMLKRFVDLGLFILAGILGIKSHTEIKAYNFYKINSFIKWFWIVYCLLFLFLIWYNLL